MVKRISVALVVLMVVTVLGSVPAAAAVTPTLSGPALIARNSTAVITGHAGARRPVQIYFHRSGEPAGHYTLRRSLTANAAGTFRTSYVADVDQAYYARSDGLASRVVVTRVKWLTISGPANANPRARVTISGHALPAGSLVTVYFHKSGQPAGYYSPRRTLRSDGAGTWRTSYVQDTDYRYYATSNGLKSAIVLTRVSPPWLQWVNAYRAAYRVPAVSQNDPLSAADALHVRYMVNTGQLGHSEDPSNPYYTKAGNAAAGRSNVAGVWGIRISDPQWVNIWMTGPFHAVGVLRPTLRTAGFASGTGRYGSFAALDVLGGNTGTDPGGWPKSYPSARAAFPFKAYDRSETPDPLASCPAAFANGTVSAPLLVSFGPHTPAVSRVSASLVRRATGAASSLCVVTESNYRNSDPGWTSTARSILGESHSVAVFARGALVARSSYTLRVASPGHTTVTVTFATT